MDFSEWDSLPDESAEAWVQRITPILRAYWRNISDPAVRLELAQQLAQALDVSTGDAWRFLTSDQPPDITPRER